MGSDHDVGLHLLVGRGHVAVLMQQSLYLAAAAQERVAHQVEVLRPHVNVV